MALGATTVWEIRSAGSNNNGGGYVPGSSGTDYTQQNAAQYALTNVTTAGADAVLLSASAAADMVGNIARIVSGTNFTVGYYEILSVVVGVSITLDRNCTTGAGDTGVVNVGGALASIGALGSNTVGLGAVAGNLICVKADGNYSLAANDTFSVAATAANPIRIIGYNSTRPTASTQGDGYLGRNTTTDGKLITTNMPNYQYQAGFRLGAGNGAFVQYQNLNLSIAGAGQSGYLVGNLGTDSVMTRCVLTNPSTNTLAGGINGNARSIIQDNDIFMTGASGGATAAGIAGNAGGVRIIANRVQMSQSSSSGPGIGLQYSAIAIRNVVIGNGGLIGIGVTVSTGVPTIDGNTIVNFVDGVNIITGTTGLQCVTNNIITDCTTYAINNVDADTATFNAYNRVRDPVTINAGTNWTTNSSFGNVTTDGAAYSDYVNQAAGDYRLISTSPAVSTAIPASASMGALQRDQTGSGTPTTVSSPVIQTTLPTIRIW